jgi:hypothetical protein
MYPWERKEAFSIPIAQALNDLTELRDEIARIPCPALDDQADNERIFAYLERLPKPPNIDLKPYEKTTDEGPREFAWVYSHHRLTNGESIVYRPATFEDTPQRYPGKDLTHNGSHHRYSDDTYAIRVPMRFGTDAEELKRLYEGLRDSVARNVAAIADELTRLRMDAQRSLELGLIARRQQCEAYRRGIEALGQ